MYSQTVGFTHWPHNVCDVQLTANNYNDNNLYANGKASLTSPKLKMQRISVVAKVNSGAWTTKSVEFEEISSSFDILDPRTSFRDFRIDRAECLSVKLSPNQNSLFLRACLLQDFGKRKLHYFEFEFQDPKERVSFSQYLKENGFFLSKKRDRFLVFVNPVSGKGKAKECLNIWPALYYFPAGDSQAYNCEEYRHIYQTVFRTFGSKCLACCLRRREILIQS